MPFFYVVITFSSDYDKIHDIIHCGTVLSKMASKSKAVPTKAARRRTTLQQVLGKKKLQIIKEIINNNVCRSNVPNLQFLSLWDYAIF